MTGYVQMTFEDWLGKTTPSVRKRTSPPNMGESGERKWCRGHKRWDCPYHKGPGGFDWLYDDIKSAMESYCRMMEELGHKVDPLFPHDVWGWMEREELPSLRVMQKYMKRMVETGKLIRVGMRQGYLLPSYGHVAKRGQQRAIRAASGTGH